MSLLLVTTRSTGCWDQIANAKAGCSSFLQKKQERIRKKWEMAPLKEKSTVTDAREISQYDNELATGSWWLFSVSGNFLESQVVALTSHESWVIILKSASARSRCPHIIHLDLMQRLFLFVIVSESWRHRKLFPEFLKVWSKTQTPYNQYSAAPKHEDLW